MLAYAQQVSELEKIARLEAAHTRAPRGAPPLGEPVASQQCLVCGAKNARACQACSMVHYCSPAHQSADSVWHDAACDQLCAAAEDDALRARGSVAQLWQQLCERPGSRTPDLLRGWESYLGSPGLNAAERRVQTDLASRPLTLARLLLELKVPCTDDVRVHVIGASAKELEAPALYAELAAFFPAARFQIALVGPELLPTPQRELPRVRFALHRGAYRRALWAPLGKPDLVLGFDAGLLLYRSWQPTLFELFGSGVPFAVTSYRPWEALAEAQVLSAVGATCVREPRPNPFASRACRRSSTIANDVSYDNSFVSVWR
jgi:hypothetical protein